MSIKRGELFRNKDRGKLAGVCAGLADYFGWETWLVRILVVSGVLLGMGWFIVVYIACWFILDEKPKNVSTFKNANASEGQQPQSAPNANNGNFADESIKVKARIWQAGEPPKQALFDIRRKFSTLEKKLRKMEQYVTSAEFTVSREINKL
ncbi:envelope stress response membrane protein PspC [Thalassotalea sp. PLHSN55]|uniref:envelope stress response membrane protein PspC n=1 Tax=Thalassotalea sp. PLHSN55 TaxID=3435888 RepID=UPI003F84EEF2